MNCHINLNLIMMRKRLWRVKGVGYFPLIFLLFQQLWGPKNSPVKPQAYKWLMHVAALFSVWNSCAERFHGFWSYIGRCLDSLNYSFEIQGTHWILLKKKFLVKVVKIQRISREFYFPRYQSCYVNNHFDFACYFTLFG